MFECVWLLLIQMFSLLKWGYVRKKQENRNIDYENRAGKDLILWQRCLFNRLIRVKHCFKETFSMLDFKVLSGNIMWDHKFVRQSKIPWRCWMVTLITTVKWAISAENNKQNPLRQRKGRWAGPVNCRWNWMDRNLDRHWKHNFW